MTNTKQAEINAVKAQMFDLMVKSEEHQFAIQQAVAPHKAAMQKIQHQVTELGEQLKTLLAASQYPQEKEAKAVMD